MRLSNFSIEKPCISEIKSIDINIEKSQTLYYNFEYNFTIKHEYKLRKIQECGSSSTRLIFILNSPGLGFMADNDDDSPFGYVTSSGSRRQTGRDTGTV